jgi:hypothetical protein
LHFQHRPGFSRLARFPVFCALLAAFSPLAHAAAPPPILATDLMAGARTPALDWRWRAPPEAALEPALFARLVRSRDAARAEAQAAGERDRRELGLDRPHALGQVWTAPFADDRLIVLLAETYAYTGGAHGNTGHAVLLWDRRGGRELPLADMFTSWERASASVQDAACAALRAQKAQRFAPDPLPADWTCPPLRDAVLVPVGRQAPGTFLRAIYSPYVAGSYAEGTYDVRFEWPDATRALARPEWRDTLFGAQQ